MSEDLEQRLRDAGSAVEPSTRPAAQRARATALNAMSPPDMASQQPAKPRSWRERIVSAVVPGGRRAVAVVAGLALVLVAATGVVTGGLLGGDEESAPVAIVGAGGSEAWPSDTLRDWVSYADQLSVVSVAGERAVPPPRGADPATDADYVAREVTLQVERTPWTRAQAPATTEEGTVSVVALGWVDQGDGERIPFRIRGGNRLEVGERYLLPLVKTADGWSLFSSRAVLDLDGDQATGKVDVGEPSAAVAQLAGASIDRAGEIVEATEPDPLAAKHAELLPAERWQAADAERESATP